MIQKRILPETFNFDVPPVEIVGSTGRGLDKTAMLKRASAFDDVIASLKPQKNQTYLHVITTGAFEKFAGNRNGDAFNESSFDLVFPYPEDMNRTHVKLGGGLKQHHDSSYMTKAAVYQEHKTKDTEPSGKIVAARYNDDMHWGELIISVDNDKWAPRLQKKASGKDIYLSMGCSVPHDICTVCGRMAKVASEHCDHFNKMRCQTLDNGTQCFVMNDKPEFYDISGVDVPADRIAFVLRKVASGAPADASMSEALYTMGTRPPMLFTKAARMLDKLSKLEKRVEGVVQGDKDDDDEVFEEDDDNLENALIIRVKRYPSDLVVDSCNRKGILLSPRMLFNIMGNDYGEEDNDLCLCDNDCCGDCSAMMRELLEDEMRNNELMDGSFDGHHIPDIGLDNILEELVPFFGMTNPAVSSRSIRIIITGRPKQREEKKQQRKKAAFNKEAQTALRRTYARYFMSFAAQNNDATCMNALRKIAHYGK